MNSLIFNSLNIATDIESSIAFRLDTYIESFKTIEGFWESMGGSKSEYEHKLKQRIQQQTRIYIRPHYQNQAIGQLEYAFNSALDDYGYLNLFYVIPAWRSKGMANLFMQYLIQQMKGASLNGILLSVSRTNTRALAFYAKHGWAQAPLPAKRPQSQYLMLTFN